VKGFQERTGALHVEDQVKAVITSIAQLRAGVAAKEVEIQVMRTYSTSDNPDLQKAEETLRGMKAGLMKLESKSGSSYDPLMPTGRMPSVGTEYVRKLRDLKFNEALYELLLKQYEAAKLDEARDAAIIQVIDRAVPPERKVSPKRAMMVFVAAFGGFFASLGLVYFMAYKEKFILEPGNRERLEEIKVHAGLTELNIGRFRRGKDAFVARWKRPVREL
jgi:tyrosine-protein kinase Etk/Wzc